jgi:hypothetical protein
MADECQPDFPVRTKSKLNQAKNKGYLSVVTPHLFLRRLIFVCCLPLLLQVAIAHPIPDIPVHTSFESGGKAVVRVDVNPRCFDEDPTTATSLTRLLFGNLSKERKEQLLKAAAELVKKDLEFYLEPVGRIQPDFRFEFSGEAGRALETDDSVVVISGKWPTQIPSGVTGWSIRSAPENKLSVVFENEINGTPHPRVAVLFPSERSFTLDLTELTGALPRAATPGSIPSSGGSGHLVSTIWSFGKQGFGHVIPAGLDHILFVLGLFLLGRSWGPLLWQVSAFTLAHSATLAMVTLGLFNASPKVVEPLIAASIALVAFENIWKPVYSLRRLLVVFAFGLVHGLGFASGLNDLTIPKGSLLAALGGFNLGVEAGQIAAIVVAFLLTGWIRDDTIYRRYVAIPGSVAIGLAGLYWTVQRLMVA